MGIKQRLIALILIVATVPVIIVGTISYLVSRSALLERVRAEFEDMITLEQLGIESGVAGVRQAADALATSNDMADIKTADANMKISMGLMNAKKANHRIKDMVVFDASAHIVASSDMAIDEDSQKKGTPLKDTYKIEEVLKGKGSSTYGTDKINAALMIPVKDVVNKDGSVIGAMLVMLDKSVFFDPLKRVLAVEANTAQASYIAANGQVLGDFFPEALKSKTDASATYNAMLALSGAEDIVSAAGMEYIVSRREVKIFGETEPAATILLMEPTRDAFAATRKLLLYVSICGLVLTGTFAFVGWRVASTLAKQLSGAVDSLRTVFGSLNTSADQVQQAATSTASAFEEQALSAQKAASALHEVNTTVEKTANFAQKSSEKSAATHTITQDGMSKAAELQVTMNKVNETVEQLTGTQRESIQRMEGLIKMFDSIAEKTSVINDIVFQTKLLSFNASVEAARAGEAGKGFAVVAEEVGNLAKLSGASAVSIGELLQTSRTEARTLIESSKKQMTQAMEKSKLAISEGVKQAESCAATLQSVVENVSAVHVMMNEVAQSSREEAIAVREISAAVTFIDELTTNNRAAVDQTKTEAESMVDHAQTLNQVTLNFEQLVFGKVSPTSKKPLSDESKDDSNGAGPIASSDGGSGSVEDLASEDITDAPEDLSNAS